MRDAACAMAFASVVRDVLLPDEILERLRPPLAREDDVAHAEREQILSAWT